MKLVRFGYLCLVVTTSLFGQSVPVSPFALPKGFGGQRVALPGTDATIRDLGLPSALTGSLFEVADMFSAGDQNYVSLAVGDVNKDGKPDMVVTTGTGVAVLIGNGDGTFVTTPTLSSGGIPGEVAVGDVDGDGNLDIVVINPCGNTICPSVSSLATVAVLLGNGQGGFGPPTLYKTGGRLSYSLALADLDGDGHLDIVTTSECPSKGYCSGSGGIVSVFYGIGNGQFQTEVTYYTYSIGTVSVALGDVNGDGRPDIVVANQCAGSCDVGLYGSIGVLLGSSTGFQPVQFFNSGGNWTQSVQIADVNGDGIPDLVAASRCPAGNDCSFAYGYTSSGTVSVLLGSGTGTFQAATAYDSGGIEPYAAMVSDVNGDGKPDLIVFNLLDENGGDTENASVNVLLGNGDGTFGSATIYAAGEYATGAAVQDVNGDGKPDILVATSCTTQNSVSGCLGVLLGNGNGTFQSAPIYAPGGYETYSLAASDLNRDGKVDLITVSQCNSLEECINGPPHNPILGALLGNGDGTFQPPALYNPGVYPTAVTVGDVNGDGIPDIVVIGCGAMTTCSGEASVLLGNGDGTFKPAVTYSTDGLVPYSVAIGDMNGDGKADLVVANSFIGLNVNNGGVAVLLGNGDGTFQPAVSYSSGGYLANYVSIGDLNGDRKLDVVVANEFAVDYTSANGTVGVLLGNGDGTLQTAVTYPTTGVWSQSAVIGDFNGDGKPDLVVENVCLAYSVSGCAASSVSTFLGNGDGTFQAAINIAGPPFASAQSGAVALADFNGDGKLDVASGSGKIVLLGNGDGTFQFAPLGAGGLGISTGDFNGDGKPDIAVGGVAVLLNISPGGATAVVSPTSVNFGNQTVGMASGSQQVTLSNTGTATLNLSSIAVNATNGSVIEANNCGTSVAAGASCAVTLSWTPSAAGNMTGSLTFSDNAANSPQVVALSGVGVSPTVTLSAAKLIFNTQVVFTSSPSQTAMLTNTGLGTLSIAKIGVSGPFIQKNTCGKSVAAGASCTFTVTFKPTTIGTLTGAISITDNAGNSPQSLALTGFGTYIALAPTSLNFGNQTVGTKSLPKRVTLSDKGSVAVSISGISFTGTNAADFAETNTCGTSVAAGASCSITVTFTPSATGSRSATLSVTDNGGASPQKVSIAGTGT